MIISTLRLFPSREQRRQVLSTLRSVAGEAKGQPHCLGCQLFEEDGHDEALMYMERWDSEEDLNRHMKSRLYGEIVGAIALSRVSPEFKFYYVNKTREMDLVEEVRSREPAERHVHNQF